MRVSAVTFWVAPLLALVVWLWAGSPVAAADLQWPPDVEADVFGMALRAEIGRAYKVPPAAVTLEGLPARGRLSIPGGTAGGDALRVRDQALRTASGRSSLPVDILEAGKLKRIATLAVRITVWSDVVVTRAAIARGTVMAADLLVVERRPVQLVPRGALTAMAAVVGQTAAMDLAPRTAVAAYLLKAAAGIPVANNGTPGIEGVRAGAEVTVRMLSSGLSLVGKGRVLDSGDVGKEVRVRLLNFPASKVVKARVFSAQEVRVVMEDPS